MELKEIMQKMQKERIRVFIGGEANTGIGVSRFGGVPDVPVDFEWPYYYSDGNYDDPTEKDRPLSFLVQVNCEELAKYDREGVLPKSGMLSFFYEEVSAKWGFDPKDKGCARVYYFERTEELKPMEFPEDLGEESRHPKFGITFEKQISYPNPSDIRLKYELTDEQFDEAFNEYREEGLVHQLLGWPMVIQGNMTSQCELIERGYYLGDASETILEEDMEAAEKQSLDKWVMLFQMAEIYEDNCWLSFGDEGNLYFYITKEDLEKRNFENVWLIYQCG